MNTTTAIGRLVAEPEMHFTAGGTPVTNMRIAIPRPGNAGGAVFIDVVCWEKLAEACAEHLGKGRQVAVAGRLDQNEWTGTDGSRHSRHQIVANQVDFLAAPHTKGAEPDAGVGED